MGTFDSSKLALPSDKPHSDVDAQILNAGIGPDLSKLTSAENRNLVATPTIADGLHKLEIAGTLIGTGAIAGATVGAGMGLAAEGTAQAMKYPLAAGLEAFGLRGMGVDLLKMESQYMSTATKFGGKGLAVGAAIGLAVYGGYEVKNYFEK